LAGGVGPRGLPFSLPHAAGVEIMI
jgi:hypothetical protein